MKPEFENRMRFVPVETITTAKNGLYQVRVNAYWPTVERDGKDCVMFYGGNSHYKGTPQCNLYKEIAEAVTDKLYPEAKIVQLPIAYVPWEE